MTWEEHNRAFLSTCLERVRRLLERHAEAPRAEAPVAPPSREDADAWPEWPAEAGRPPALRVLCETFGLSPFERDVLLLGAGMELDSRIPAACARAQGDAQRPYPTFALALAALPHAHWDALSPQGALRQWDLVTVGLGSPLTQEPLRVEERIWQYLIGIDGLDERLARCVQPPPDARPLVPTHEALARQVAATCAGAARDSPLPVVQLVGRSASDQATLAQHSTALLGLSLLRAPAENLPDSQDGTARFASLWNREALLGGHALLLDCHNMDSSEPARVASIQRLVASIHGLLFLATPERRATGTRTNALYEVPPLSIEEQRAFWTQGLERSLEPQTVQRLELPETIDALVNQFTLDCATIEAATTQGLGQLLARGGLPKPGEVREALWAGSQAQCRQRLEGLAQRLNLKAHSTDLILSETQARQLAEVETHVRHRALIHETWGFSTGSWRGMGTSVLLAGPSGTGKTLAAEVLAKRLGLDLYRIDLSGVVNKYVGETEKNLRKVFDAAEAGGCALLFDEADALFGQRSEVRDSHDRYANLEVSYLLQRVESFQGLAILTTNRQSDLDRAFSRRLQFVVNFSMPGPEQRKALWVCSFPSGAPIESLDFEHLSNLEISGALIRKIAVNAAFLAAEEGWLSGQAPHISMRNINTAALREAERQQLPIHNIKFL
ncbi:ATP-binding protein [Archangium primigenium]|uniref:ATP-binding protein n=1 Tax=[Archangium] primigenium TaxID=2792470 RepID=UPI00195D9900|nr:ATP-binding protein [Archangium primigenium]MBM7116701.1 AAA family ATPase [Archangium primigenium]